GRVGGELDVEVEVGGVGGALIADQLEPDLANGDVGLREDRRAALVGRNRVGATDGLIVEGQQIAGTLDRIPDGLDVGGALIVVFVGDAELGPVIVGRVSADGDADLGGHRGAGPIGGAVASGVPTDVVD